MILSWQWIARWESITQVSRFNEPELAEDWVIVFKLQNVEESTGVKKKII